MQLCEFCTQNTPQPNGTICRLPKRENGILFDPCEDFERAKGISQDRYEQVKALLLRLRSQAEAEARDDRPVYNIDIPMEITPQDVFLGVPRDLHTKLLETDFGDPEQAANFLIQPSTLHLSLTAVISDRPKDTLATDLASRVKQSKQDMLEIVNILDRLEEIFRQNGFDDLPIPYI